MVPLLFRLEDVVSMMLPKKNIRFLFFLQKSLVYTLCMSTLAQSVFVDGTVSCVDRKWFLEVFLNPCSDFHDRIMPVFNAVPPDGLNITGIHY